jgi:hypothetical protein
VFGSIVQVAFILKPKHSRFGSQERVEIVRTSSAAVRITGWYDWLLVVLVLAFGAYTYECLRYCLSIGVENALSIRAKEIGRMFAQTGQVPVSQVSDPPGLIDQFISVHQSGGRVRELSANPGRDTVAPIKVRRPMDSVRRMANGAPLFVATIPLTIGNQRYVVEVGTPKRTVKVALRGIERRLCVGLVVGLALATWGSWILIKRALVPVRKIFLAVQALPVAHPDDRFKCVAVLDEIERLCATVNDMIDQLEESFPIGAGLSSGAALAPRTPLRAVRAELAALFEHKRLSMGVANSVLCLLRETERLSDIARELSTPAYEDARQIKMKRLRFYFGERVACGAEHVCVLTRKLGADLAAEARSQSREHNLIRW